MMDTFPRLIAFLLFASAIQTFPNVCHAGQKVSKVREDMAMKAAISARGHHQRAADHARDARFEKFPHKQVHRFKEKLHKAAAFPKAVGAKVLHKRDPMLRNRSGSPSRRTRESHR